MTDSGENISENKLKIQYIMIPLSFALIYGYYFISQKIIDKDFETLTKYTATLWGKKESLDGVARLFVLSMLCYLIILLLYRKRLIMKQVFALMLVTLCCVEGMNSIRLYMVSPAVNNPKRTTDFVSLSEMSDKIQDDNFYRVKTDFKAADYNMTGALGYPSVSHYTSLTDHDFMVMQRLFGYSTVWMKSGSAGGTELTNALYCIKYNITEGKATDDTVYTNGKYSINSISPCLGLGILCSSDFSGGTDISDSMTRAEIQQYLFENTFDTDKKLITEYDYDRKKSTGISFSNNKYQLSGSAKVKYDIDVSGSTKTAERKRILKDYADKKIQVLCACDLLNEGWDSPKTEVLFMARPTMSKTIYMQQLGRGMRTHQGKDFLMVFDFVDNANMFNCPYSLHRMLNLAEYVPGGLVLGTKHGIAWDNDMFRKGEKPAVLIDYPIHALDYEIIDIFNWQDKANQMYSQMELTRRVSAQEETISRYIKEKKILPDMAVPISEHKTLYYFNRERVREYCQRFGWTEITSANKKQLFLDFCNEMQMSYSYKPVFIMSFLSCINEKGEAVLSEVAEAFAWYYEDRKKQGLPAEKKNCIFTKGGYTAKDVERLTVILRKALKAAG